MSRLATLALGAFVFCPASAEACAHVTDDDERLACFDAAQDCASIQSSGDRLECFDDAYSKRESREPDDVKSVSAALDKTPEESGEGTEPSSSGILTAEIIKVTTNAYEVDFIHLDNGQIWRENENSRVRFKAGQTVSIEEGILGSFNLTVEGSSKTVKVNKVK